MGKRLKFEREAGFPGIRVVGLDEVGRGCLAGPVVAAAFELPSDPAAWSLEERRWLGQVRDSKKLTPELRAELAPRLRDWAARFGGRFAIAWADVAEIDRINIYHASHLAMVRALEGLGEPRLPRKLLVDGNRVPRELPPPCQAIVGGDDLCLSIAAASIVAKFHRDAWMVELDREHPGYGLGQHKGYSTPEHQEALKRLGPVASLHRKAFAPVAALLAPAEAESTQLALEWSPVPATDGGADFV